MADPPIQRSTIVSIAAILFTLVVAIGGALFLIIMVQWPGPWRWILAVGLLGLAAVIAWSTLRSR